MKLDELTNKVYNSLIKLNDYLIKNEFKGYEFDDFLSSPIINFISFGNLFLKRVYIQIGEISPINFRKFLFIKKQDSFKARAFFAEGAALMYGSTKEMIWKNYARIHLDYLRNNYNKNFKGFGWGNHFDFASRGGFFPKFVPTIVWTSKVVDAAYKVIDIIPELRDICLELILGAANFITNDLEKIKDNTGICFAYAPGILEPIHNSNLLGASSLAKAFKFTKDQNLSELIKNSLNWSLSRINLDGSWYYGDSKKYNWIDNFHTAYNLDSLIDIYEIDNNLVEFKYIKKTYDYWIKNFFLNNGICKYYHNKVYPIDIQSIAQAIETLSKTIKYFNESKNILTRVTNWALNNMQNSDGSFCYQIRRFWKNKIPYIHWGQATMFAALSHFLYASEKYNENSNT